MSKFESLCLFKIFTVLCLVLLGIQPCLAQADEHDENHHHHHHYANVKTTDNFIDSDVTDRPLKNWQGNWQSAYEYLTSGELDNALTLKAQKKQISFDELKQYYQTGYQTDIDMITIEENNTMNFFKDVQAVSCQYVYDGFKILTYESGSKGVRYLFHCDDKNSQAPLFVQFSDHIIESAPSSHFHIFMGNESHDSLLEEMDNWPTYYPLSYKAKDIAHDFIYH